MYREQTGVSINKINLDTCLLDDLGIDGDDGADFFASFLNEFGVDLSEIDLSRHFGPEGGGNIVVLFIILFYLVYNFFRWLTMKIFRIALKPIKFGSDLEPISVRKLIEAAKMGKWQY